MIKLIWDHKAHQSCVTKVVVFCEMPHVSSDTIWWFTKRICHHWHLSIWWVCDEISYYKLAWDHDDLKIDDNYIGNILRSCAWYDLTWPYYILSVKIAFNGILHLLKFSMGLPIVPYYLDPRSNSLYHMIVLVMILPDTSFSHTLHDYCPTNGYASCFAVRCII